MHNSSLCQNTIIASQIRVFFFILAGYFQLFNRLTRQICLKPFTLEETDLFLRRKHISLSAYELAVCYMVFGGIPYYLSLLDETLSLAQNIDILLFNRNGELHYEFNNLYAALFNNSQDYVRWYRHLAIDATA